MTRSHDDQRTYKILEVVGSSPNGSDEAIRNAIRDVGQSVKHLAWYEVTEQRGHIEQNEIAHFQVTLRVGFRVDA